MRSVISGQVVSPTVEVDVFSLVNAPALGFELCRRPGGARTAEVLRHALALTAADLPVLARARQVDESGPASGDVDRTDAWLAMSMFEREVQASEIIRDVGDALARQDDVAMRSSVRALERSPLGTLDQLLRMVRHDILDWTWRRGPDGIAVQDAPATAVGAVLCDAAAAGYLEHSLSDEHRRVLVAPWLRAVRSLPDRDDDLGVRHAEVRALLGRIGAMSMQQWNDLVDVADEHAKRGEPGGWAKAAHEASWSVFLSGRLRASAAAQLLLVIATADQRVPVTTLARGAFNAVSGAVLAEVAADLLGEASHHRLAAPLTEVLAVG